MTHLARLANKKRDIGHERQPSEDKKKQKEDNEDLTSILKVLLQQHVSPIEKNVYIKLRSVGRITFI